MKTALLFKEDLDQLKTKILITIKLRISKLFKNYPDLSNDIDFRDYIKSFPIYENSDEDFNTTIIESIRLEDDILYFTYSSEILDSRESNEKYLNIEHLLSILNILENIKEIEL